MLFMQINMYSNRKKRQESPTLLSSPFLFKKQPTCDLNLPPFSHQPCLQKKKEKRRKEKRAYLSPPNQ